MIYHLIKISIFWSGNDPNHPRTTLICGLVPLFSGNNPSGDSSCTLFFGSVGKRPPVVAKSPERGGARKLDP